MQRIFFIGVALNFISATIKFLSTIPNFRLLGVALGNLGVAAKEIKIVVNSLTMSKELRKPSQNPSFRGPRKSGVAQKEGEKGVARRVGDKRASSINPLHAPAWKTIV